MLENNFFPILCTCGRWSVLEVRKTLAETRFNCTRCGLNRKVKYKKSIPTNFKIGPKFGYADDAGDWIRQKTEVNDEQGFFSYNLR